MEWNSGLYDRVRLDEILQIGAVKVSGAGSPILDTFNCFIRPRVHRRFSPAAAELPDLELARRSTVDFPTALKRFLDWCGEDRTFGTWGNSDLIALTRSKEFWKAEGDLPQDFIDLQRAFAQAAGAAHEPSLERAAEYRRVPDSFDPHNALNDAVTAWLVCEGLTDEELEDSRRPLVTEGAHQRLPKRGTPWKGNHATLARLLQSPSLRQSVCPRCGRVNQVTRWYPAPDGFYCAPYTCDCGRSYYLRLEVAQHKGRFWGNAVPLRITARHRSELGMNSPQSPVDLPPEEAPRRKRRRRRRRPGYEKKTGSPS